MPETASPSFTAEPLGRNEVCLRSFAERMGATIPISRGRERPSPERPRTAL